MRFLLVCFLFATGSLIAQECTTQPGSSFYNKEVRELKRQSGRAATQSFGLPEVYKEVPIVFHILYAEGLTDVTEAAVLETVLDLNAKFNSAKFRFVLVGIYRKNLQDFPWYQEYITVPSTSNALPSMKGGTGMSKVFDIANAVGIDPPTTLNVYVLPRTFSVQGWSFIPPFGVTSINSKPKNPDGVWVRSATFAQSSAPGAPKPYNRNATLIHEIGHYFGLYHTFQGSFSCEDFGLPCESTGDLVCDTPPVKESTPLQNCAPPCAQPFDPSKPWADYEFDNHMDYLSGKCRKSFTDGQIARMHLYVSSKRLDLYREIPTPCLADLNQDGNVNSQDFLLYLSCHGQSYTTADCYKCDFNGDGLVGSADHLFFLSMIGQTCTR